MPLVANCLNTAYFDEYIKGLLRPNGGLDLSAYILQPEKLPEDLHVVIADTSTYYHNYRHVTNALIMYRIVKWLGVPDSNIHLFLGECSACDPRNVDPGKIYYEPGRRYDIFEGPGQIEVDYHKANVHSITWMTLLSGRQEAFTPLSQVLKSKEGSNVLVYINGHGGNQFTKFQDFDELSADEIAEAFLELFVKHKYQELFFLIDSCQALTLGDQIYAPNTVVLGSSQIDENAYSCNDDSHIGLSLMDRFTYKTALLLQNMRRSEAYNLSISDYQEGMDIKYLMAPPGTRSDRLGRDLKQTLLLSFLADPLIFKNMRDDDSLSGGQRPSAIEHMGMLSSKSNNPIQKALSID